MPGLPPDDLPTRWALTVVSVPYALFDCRVDYLFLFCSWFSFVLTVECLCFIILVCLGYCSWQADVGCRWNCPFPLPLTVASLTSVLVRLLMPARVVTGLALRNKSMTVCAFFLNEGRSAVRLGLWNSRFFACSFGSLLGRRPPVSSLLLPSSWGSFGANWTGSWCLWVCHGAPWTDGTCCWCSAVGWQLHGAWGLLPQWIDSSDCPCGWSWALLGYFFWITSGWMDSGWSAMGYFDLQRRLLLWCIDRPLRGGLSRRKDGMRFQFIPICDPRRSLQISPTGTMIYTPIGNR